MKKTLALVFALLIALTGCSVAAEPTAAPVSAPEVVEEVTEEAPAADTVTKKVIVPVEEAETVIVEDVATVEETEEAAAWQAWDSVGAGEVYVPEGGRVDYIGSSPSNYEFEVTESVTSAPVVAAPRIQAPVAAAAAPAVTTPAPAAATPAPLNPTTLPIYPVMGKSPILFYKCDPNDPAPILANCEVVDRLP